MSCNEYINFIGKFFFKANMFLSQTIKYSYTSPSICSPVQYESPHLSRGFLRHLGFYKIIILKFQIITLLCKSFALLKEIESNSRNLP